MNGFDGYPLIDSKQEIMCLGAGIKYFTHFAQLNMGTAENGEPSCGFAECWTQHPASECACRQYELVWSLFADGNLDARSKAL
jgi:hypothetical protein